MKTKTLLLSGTGPQTTPWYRVDPKQTQFQIGVMVDLGNGADANYGLDIGFSDKSNDVVNASISRSGTAATIATQNPYLMSAKTGDSIVVQGYGAPFDGTYSVTNTSGVLTFTVANSGPTIGNLGNGASVTLIRVFPNSTGVVIASAVQLTTPFNFLRLNVASMTTGTVAMTVNQGIDG